MTDQQPLDPLTAINKRLFEVENRLARHEKLLEHVAASVEERALSVVELLCDSVGTQIKRGRELRKRLATLSLEPITPENPANEKTVMVMATEQGVRVFTRDEKGEFTLPAQDEVIIPLAANFIAKHQIEKNHPVLVNIYQHGNTQEHTHA